MSEETAGALVPVSEAELPSLFAQGAALDATLAKIEERVRSETLDVQTEAGRKAGKSLAYKVTRSKTLLDETGKRIAEDHRAEVKRIDGLRKQARDRLDALRDEVRQPVLDYEAREQKRIHAHERAMSDLHTLAHPVPGASSEVLRGQMESLNALAERDWEEHEETARGLIEAGRQRIEAGIADAEAREAERAELEELRRFKAEMEAQKAAQQAAEAVPAEKADDAPETWWGVDYGVEPDADGADEGAAPATTTAWGSDIAREVKQAQVEQLAPSPKPAAQDRESIRTEIIQDLGAQLPWLSSNEAAEIADVILDGRIRHVVIGGTS